MPSIITWKWPNKDNKLQNKLHEQKSLWVFWSLEIWQCCFHPSQSLGKNWLLVVRWDSTLICWDMKGESDAKYHLGRWSILIYFFRGLSNSSSAGSSSNLYFAISLIPFFCLMQILDKSVHYKHFVYVKFSTYWSKKAHSQMRWI